MQTRAIIFRQNLKGLMPLILVIGSFVFLYYPSTMAQYVKTSGISGVRENTKDVSATDREKWREINSAYFTIYYQPTANLKTMERKLRRRGSLRLAGNPRPIKLNSVEEKIAYDMDTLFRRVKEILDIHPRVKNIKVKIFKNRKELSDEYEKVFGKRADLISFYIYKYNTIE